MKKAQKNKLRTSRKCASSSRWGEKLTESTTHFNNRRSRRSLLILSCAITARKNKSKSQIIRAYRTQNSKQRSAKNKQERQRKKISILLFYHWKSSSGSLALAFRISNFVLQNNDSMGSTLKINGDARYKKWVTIWWSTKLKHRRLTTSNQLADFDQQNTQKPLSRLLFTSSTSIPVLYFFSLPFNNLWLLISPSSLLFNSLYRR